MDDKDKTQRAGENPQTDAPPPKGAQELCTQEKDGKTGADFAREGCAQPPKQEREGRAEVLSAADKEPQLRYRNKREAVKGGVLGFFIGLAIIVPGVSGSTVAILFRLYEKLLYAIGNILKKFTACLRFLLPIGAGAVIGFVLGFFAVRWLLDVSPFTVIALFAGLMLGAYPAVLDEVRGGKKSFPDVFLFCVGLLVPLAASLFSTFGQEGARALEGLAWYHYILFFALGFVVAVTQIVPGLSATAVLMMAGYFKPLMDSVSAGYWSENPAVFAVYFCLGIGFLLGLVLVSKGMTKLFEKHRKRAFFCICGLSLGSILTMFFNPEVYAVYTAWADGAPFALDLCIGVLLFAAGAALSTLFVRVERKKKGMLSR